MIRKRPKRKLRLGPRNWRWRNVTRWPEPKRNELEQSCKSEIRLLMIASRQSRKRVSNLVVTHIESALIFEPHLLRSPAHPRPRSIISNNSSRPMLAHLHPYIAPKYPLASLLQVITPRAQPLHRTSHRHNGHMRLCHPRHRSARSDRSTLDSHTLLNLVMINYRPKSSLRMI